MKKVQICERFSFPSEMKLAGTSDHSQYLFVVSRLTECGPSVYFGCEIGFAHVSVTALNQRITSPMQAESDHIIHIMDNQPPTKQQKQTVTHWTSNMVIPNISANMKLNMRLINNSTYQ